MENEKPFRICLLVIVVLLSTITIVFRRRAKSSDERISHSEEGWIPYLALHCSATILWVSSLAYLSYPSLVAWAAFPLPAWVRWLAFGLALFASLPMTWSLASLGKNLTDTVAIKSDAYLVTSGPYRWVRHPYYVTTAMVMATVTLLTANWLIGLGCAMVLTLLAIRTPNEEQKLEARFGHEYLLYKAKTGMFFPRLTHSP